MSWTRDDIADLFALFEGAGLRPPPAFATDAGYNLAVRVWTVALDEIPLAAVHGAFGLHLRTPERARFWPSVGDLVAHIPQAQALVLAPPMDPDEQAWERILAATRKGPSAPELVSHVTFREVTTTEEIRRWSAEAQAEVLVRTTTVNRVERCQAPSQLERALTPEHLAALRQIGGVGGIWRADAESDSGQGRAVLRRRFLALCRTPAATSLEAPPVRVALPDGAPAFLRLALAGGYDQAAARQRTLERARRDG